MTIKIKDMFTSRYKDDGVIIQADQSQLELRILGYLSQDEELIQKFIDDVDLHMFNAQQWKGRQEITKEERTAAKAMSFQLTYGSGPGNMARILEIPYEEAKSFIKEFYDTYSGVKRWHEDLKEKIITNQSGELSWLQGPSGRIWWFKEYPSPQFMQDRGVFKSFKPTEYKNLPCQGTASDVMIIHRGQLIRKLLQYSTDCCIINTVHDSVILDCKTSVKEDVINILKETMEDVGILNKVFNVPFNVPLKVDISVGPSWGNLEEVN